MAIWQFDIHLLPIAACETRVGPLPSSLSMKEFDEIDAWHDVRLGEAVTHALSSLLPPATSWSDTLDIYGDDAGDRIDLSYDDEGTLLKGVFVRIDLRSFSFPFVEAVVRAARDLDLAFYIPNGTLNQPDRNGPLIRPDIDRVIAAIRDSDNFRYVRDPRGFLDELGRDKDRDE